MLPVYCGFCETAFKFHYRPRAAESEGHQGQRAKMKKGKMHERSTCSKLVVGDFKGLDLQFECVEREGWRHGQNLLCVAHVGATKRTAQVVETGVAG